MRAHLQLRAFDVNLHVFFVDVQSCAGHQRELALALPALLTWMDAPSFGSVGADAGDRDLDDWSRFVVACPTPYPSRLARPCVLNAWVHRVEVRELVCVPCPSRTRRHRLLC